MQLDTQVCLLLVGRISDERRMVIGLTLARLVAAVLLLVSGLPAAEAQPAVKVFRIGLLGTVPLTEPGAARIWSGFFEGLQQLGYVEGQNLVIEGRYTEGESDRLPTLAAALVRLKVNVIVAAAHTAAAAKGATSTIPIAMTNHGDPLSSGLVATLARPGGNATGMSTLAVDLVGKQLQLLKEAMPPTSRCCRTPPIRTTWPTCIRLKWRLVV
jgi:putative tryptophan/tyrosine transport system substrate-binding protein